MQHGVIGSIQVQNGQAIAFNPVLVGIAVVVDANTPLFGHVGVLGAVKANTIVIIRFSIAELWLFNNVVRTVVDYFFHRITSLT